MKVGILVDEIAPGSAPKLIGQPIKGLRQLGHEAEALILVKKSYQEKYREVYNHHLKDIPIRYLFNKFPQWAQKLDFKFPGFSFFSTHHLLSYFFAPKVIREREFDIIIAHCQYSAFTARALKRKRKIPYLLLVWDPATYTLKKIYTKTWLKFLYPILYFFAFILDKFATKGAEALITSGRLHHKRFRKISGKNVEDLYPGCFSLDTLPPFKEREKAILTYDRWDVGNRPNIFLDLLANLEDDVRLKLGGFWHPESIRKEFMEEAKERKMLDRIDLLGPLDEKMIMNLCSKVILHIHPNEEAFGMQSLEAAACGCPIIIPAGSGVTDLFQHGVHGYFPEKNNLKDLIKYTQFIFKDVNRAEEMGYRAWQVAKRNTWKEHALRLEEIIKKYI